MPPRPLLPRGLPVRPRTVRPEAAFPSLFDVHLPVLFFAPEEKDGDWSNRTTRLVVVVLSDLALAGRDAAAAVNLTVAARSVRHVLSAADPEVVPENSLAWSAILVACPCSAGTHPELLWPDSLASGPVSFS
jgi:hypothetical protein